jgi:hypothetical protein
MWRKILVFLCTAGVMAFLASVAQGQDNKKQDVLLLIDYKIRASNYGDAGKYQDEIDLCDKGLKDFPGDPDLQGLRAEGIGGLGKYDDAKTIFLEIMTAHRSDSQKDRLVRFWTFAKYKEMMERGGNATVIDDLDKQITQAAGTP